MASKTCRECKIEKPVEAYTPSKQTKDGYLSACKECTAAYARTGYEKDKKQKEARVRPEFKLCDTCERLLPGTEFYKRAGNADGLHRWCKSCADTKKASTRDPAKERARDYLKKYGITPEDYDRMFAEQSGRCKMCLGADTGKSTTTVFDVDHDHKIEGSLGVRGLLCSPCNRGLGLQGDDASVQIRGAFHLIGEDATLQLVLRMIAERKGAACVR